MAYKAIKTRRSIRNGLCVGNIDNQPSLNPKIYIVTAKPWEMYLGIPKLPPTSSPRDWEIIAYAPPAPILIFVVIDDMDNAVQSVMPNEIIMINHAPSSPPLPTTHPNLKYIITPSMVKSVGVNTPPKVLNFLGDAIDNVY